MKPRILVSACLLGVNCRYDGGGKAIPEVAELMELAELVPVCPEILGGLPTPRAPSERVGARVLAKGDGNPSGISSRCATTTVESEIRARCPGADVTANFARGAGEALKLAELFGARYALLKERSPSCGSGQIYDGSFSGGLTRGDGVTAELLKGHGIAIYGESRVEELREFLKEE